MTPVDLLLIEGFKTHPHPKLELHRASEGQPLLCLDDPDIVAVVTDEALPGLDRPQLALDAPGAVAAFILGRTGLAPEAGG